MLYGCALKVFNNRSVAKWSALFVAVFPACVIWSSQLLKDGLIIFLLILVMTMVLKLQEKFGYLALTILILALFGIIALRFYIFYVAAVAVVGSFVIGSSKSQQTIIKRLAACLLIGAGLAYLGGLQSVSENFERYGNLKQLQRGREWSARVSGSGYGEETDISTTEGAVAALPVGFTYLMFAPFPWQATNLRQAIAVPETFLWWASMPLLVMGFIYTLKHRLRNAIAIILFTVLLTLAYSITQSNVGTAYRMRTQIQVFLFMFIAVGWQLRKEKKEIERHQATLRKKQLEEHIRKTQNKSASDLYENGEKQPSV
jgi:4-amino-4-deoxy-L-arabinose transferase-like glycosyltransferase